MKLSPRTCSVTSSSEAAKISARLFRWKEEEDMKILSRVIGNSCLSNQRFHLSPKRWISTVSHEQEPKEFDKYLDFLKNYEKCGVPKGAGTDSDDGFDLGRMERLLAALGNPHFKFKAVHIAGTKGKGSTAAFVANILRAQGYSVGCYTSPHILTVRERMTLGRFGKPVSENILDNLFYKIKPTLDEEILRENGALSHFEVLTAVAFTLFADEKTEIAVIEAGLGGARDATNVLRNSELAASIITTIGEEHLEALGGSLESIAMAKAGIIKYGCPVVLGGPFPLHIRKILFDKAESMSSPVVSVCDEEIKITKKGVDFFNGKPLQQCDIAVRLGSGFQESIQLSNMRLSMLGSHQLHNAVTAACTSLCLRHQGWEISDESIRTGLESTCLPGRSHFLSSKEAESLGITGTTVLLDGAHTKESAKALSDTIKETFPVAKLGFVIAMARDKDHVGFAKQLLSGTQAEAVFLTEAEIGGSKSRTTPSSLLRDRWLQASSELGKIALHDGMPEFDTNKSKSKVRSGDETILAAENCPVVAMGRASKILEEGKGSDQLSVLVVTGSLHVVSSVIASLNPQPQYEEDKDYGM